MFLRPVPRSIITEDKALPGRPQRPFTISPIHAVLGTPLEGPWPDGTQVLYVGMGCFWGAEKRFWSLPGIVTTAVGYQGGHTAHPTYEEVCSGATGHAENVLVAYDPQRLSTWDVLRVFWENHDPTQGHRQGNDVGTQYRSAVYWTSAEQGELVHRSAAAYEAELLARGFDPITSDMRPADGLPFYYAEDYHQQYLHKIPHGYDCHAHTGIHLPDLAAVGGTEVSQPHV
jgi:peptide-methionine (S)-S-oxide reductase